MKPSTQPSLAPVDAAELRELRRALAVGHVCGQALVRRGFAEPATARAWLAARGGAPHEIAGLDAAAALIESHVAAGRRIVVHGDYDVDGVTATAILLDTLERLGATPDWHLPRRGEDGYGLTDASLRRLEALGAELVITVDCGIGSVEEVATLRERGVDVIVTDHHQPRASGQLPDALLVHPLIDDARERVAIADASPRCGAGVAAALADRLLDRAGATERALRDGITELVALATIADCVPLVDENRKLVRDGLAALARTRRPGLRALLRETRVHATGLDSTAVAFRLAPRLNAAGRVARADVALELLRCSDDERASQLTVELERCNQRRKELELRVRGEAEKQLRELGERPAYVVWGDDWPAGVIGIVAARLAEQSGRPALVIGLDGDSGSGSGRTAGGIDLAALLQSCTKHLVRHGGHAAAAGCEVTRDQLVPLRAAFEAAAELAAADAVAQPVTVDAVADVADLTLELADELAAFQPTGIGNPPVVVLLLAVRLEQVAAMSSGQHHRCVVTGGGARTKAVAFDSGPLPQDELVDVIAELERSTWGGVVEARLIIRSVTPSADAIDAVTAAAAVSRSVELAWIEQLVAEIEAAQALVPADAEPVVQASPTSVDDPSVVATRSAGGASSTGPLVLDRRGRGAASTVALLRAWGRDPIVYAADPAKRAKQLAAAGITVPVVDALGLAQRLGNAGGTDVVVLADPPLHPVAREALDRALVQRCWAWGEAELTFAVHVLEREFALRPLLVTLYRTLQQSGALSLDELVAFCAAEPGAGPAAVGRCVRVLDELGLARWKGRDAGLQLGDGERTQLDRSDAYRGYQAIVDEGRAWTTVN